MARTRLAARAKAQKGDPIPRSVAKALKKAELKKRAADSKKRAEEKKQKAIAARKAREEKKKDRLTLFRNQMFPKSENCFGISKGSQVFVKYFDQPSDFEENTFKRNYTKLRFEYRMNVAASDAKFSSRRSQRRAK